MAELADLTEPQFKRFASFIYGATGIHLKEQKITLLSNRLRRRLRALSLEDFDSYYDLLTGTGDIAEREMVHFLEAITTNETYFWRTTQNFAMLREDIVPFLLKLDRRPLRFWSAGASSGEEAYNLAIELIESMKIHGVFDFTIEGTDISQRMLDFAEAGRYSGRKIEKVPDQALRRYFRQDPKDEAIFQVRDDVRSRVTFRKENLFESTVKNVHCILCRNVMIYFQRADQERLVERFYQALLPGGFLIVGHSESLHMLNTPFRSMQLPNGVAYMREKENHA